MKAASLDCIGVGDEPPADALPVTMDELCGVPGPDLTARLRAFLAAPPAWKPKRRGGAISARGSNGR